MWPILPPEDGGGAVSGNADLSEPTAAAWWVTPASSLPPDSHTSRPLPGDSEPKAVEGIPLHPQLFRDPGIHLSRAGQHML